MSAGSPRHMVRGSSRLCLLGSRRSSTRSSSFQYTTILKPTDCAYRYILYLVEGSLADEGEAGFYIRPEIVDSAGKIVVVPRQYVTHHFTLCECRVFWLIVEFARRRGEVRRFEYREESFVRLIAFDYVCICNLAHLRGK